ncbi:MAG: ATP-binding protein [Acidimicrobiales bacterium]
MDSGDRDDTVRQEVPDVASVRRFLDLSLDLLGICDLGTRLIEVSESWERMLGWTRSELLGTPLLDYLHPDDLPRVAAKLAALLRGHDAPGVECRVRCRDGRYKWVQGNARPDLAIQRIYVTATDITARKASEQALVRQIALEELVATITGRLLGADDSDVPDVVRRALEELARAMRANRAHFVRGGRRTPTRLIEWLDPLTGQRSRDPFDRPPAVNQWWLDVIKDERILRVDDVEELGHERPDVLADLRRAGVRSVLHVPLRPHRGSWGFVSVVSTHENVTFYDEAAPLMQLAGEAFLSALSRGDDAAALADARRELEDRNDELERSNEELERFAQAAAHDLKAPLARIEMALAATPRPEGEDGVLVDVARRGASRMRRLIEDLLAFSEVARSNTTAEEVDLEDLLAQVLSDLAPTITAVHAEVSHGPLPTAWGHRSLLGQVLQNLVGNALKFARHDVVPRIEISGTGGVEGTTIRVIDNGIGVEGAKRNAVFGVFTRLNADEQYPGSGIGLATCAKIAAYHGGQIRIEDGIDGGVAVVVELPPRPADADSGSGRGDRS